MEAVIIEAGIQVLVKHKVEVVEAEMVVGQVLEMVQLVQQILEVVVEALHITVGYKVQAEDLA